jgi:CheY-like chemotaxis protein/HPt (histidine-containing phosphotransfer) domain-containing protein
MEDPSHLYELLELLESGILSLEKDRTADPAVAIHRLFQSAHNLKSGLAMAGLERASKRFHGLEDGLDDIRRGRSRWTAAWADAVFDTVDRIRDCLDRGDLDPEFQVPDSPATSAPGSVPTPALSPEEREAAMGLPPGHNLFRIEKLFLPGLTREEFEGHLIYEDIRDSGTLVSVRPDWEGYRQAPGETVVRFLFSSAQTAEMLGNLFFDPLIPVTIPDPPAGSVPGYRLLIVDDDRVVANLVAKQIAAYGTAVLAPDGVAGLETFRREFDAGRTFDVVILDLEMPGLDGHQTLQGIRDHEESRGIHGLDRCLVFMNTSNPDLAKVKASFRLQADRYFIKPLSVDQIKKGLEDCLPWLENRRRGA